LAIADSSPIVDVPGADCEKFRGAAADTRRWREFATARPAPEREIRLMVLAFEHEELAAIS
jgi:hypothetical protein